MSAHLSPEETEMTSDQIYAAIREAMALREIKITCAHVPPSALPPNLHDEWRQKAVNWHYCISGAKPHFHGIQKQLHHGYYSQGLGLVEYNRKLPPELYRHGHRQGFEHEVIQTGVGSFGYRDYKANKPAQEDIMASCIRDAYDGSFKDFCNELGYDEDSRSAYAIWETCRDTRYLLLGIFGPDLLADLQEMVNQL
jgi:hypothetical protein